MPKLYFTGYKGKSFISKLIKYWTRSEYSHVEQCLNLETLKGYGAYQGYKVGYLYPSYHEKGTRYDIFELECTQEQLEKFNYFKRQQEGKKYDYKGIMGFVTNKEEMNNRNKWYCSEIEIYACNYAGIRLLNWDVIKMKLVSPGMFLSSPLLKKIKSGKT